MSYILSLYYYCFFTLGVQLRVLFFFFPFLALVAFFFDSRTFIGGFYSLSFFPFLDVVVFRIGQRLG